jgi:hypothetical protein
MKENDIKLIVGFLPAAGSSGFRLIPILVSHLKSILE